MQLYKRHQFKVLLTAMICFIILLMYWKSRHSYTTFQTNTSFQYFSNIKYVLYWSPFWNQKDYFWGYGFEPFKDCKYKNCYATDNRTLIPLEKFDALIFHATTYDRKRHGVPWIRKSHQRYIIMNVEAPVYICPDLKQYASYFNWTMTYRFDSDIVRRHGYWLKEKTGYTYPSEDFINNKTKLIAWFVSNCETPGKRELLVKRIQKFAPVDVYGYCGPLRCSRKAGNAKLSSSGCYDMVERDYKFYLAFENSYCKDYSTEKLYNTLLKNVIPVVYGAGDYKLSAPPHSVINVDDFKTIEELVKYLTYLDKNNSEYLKYFEWKKDYSVNTAPNACQLCERLNEPLIEKIYHDLHGWWWGENNSACKRNKHLPHYISELL